MDKIISLIFILLFFGGCAGNNVSLDKTGISHIKAFEESGYAKKRVMPKMILPPVYKKISVFDGRKITLNAENATLDKILYTISKSAGLNLIIDKDVEKDIPITLAVKDASLKKVLDIVMNMSGCFYKIEGNILHVKEYMQKRFVIPYIHSDTSFATKLGGDILSSATSGSGSSGGSSGGGEGISGKYTLDYKSPESMKGFYKQLDENIKLLLSKEGKYTLNRFTGVLTVYDKKRNIDRISDFLSDMQKVYGRQVLIEAKILEVSLNKSHQLGIDWSLVEHSVFKNGDTLQLTQGLGLAGDQVGTVTYTKTNFSAIIDAIDQNGKIETVANPRIRVLNGQSAIISSGRLIPYWEKEVDTSQGTSTNNIQVTYNRRDVLNGITLGVTPTIMDNGKIMLNIIPISSTIEGEKSYQDENGATVATAPIVNIKEAGTVIYANDNDMVLIGGLMSTKKESSDKSVPFFSKMPLLGNLFKQTNNTNEKRELVILMRIKIIK